MSVYKQLGDDLSREVFSNRLMYSYTTDMRYIRNIIKMTPEGRELFKKMQAHEGKKVIFGAGIWGRQIASVFGTEQFACFVDNNEGNVGKEVCGITVVSFEEYMSKYSNYPVVVSSRFFYKDIIKQLLGVGISEEMIINVGQLTAGNNEKQYFDLAELSHKTGEEVFIDAGSFDGGSSKAFIKWCEGDYKKIYAFEPDEKNWQKCRAGFQGIEDDKYEIIERGLWDIATELKFCVEGTTSSCISEDGEQVIRTIRLDDAVAEPVTFIKMDIEGAEYAALKGAESILRKDKPKLAICVYHKPEDILEIPLLILSINPEYKFYLRHYSVGEYETVLYAI